MATKFGKTWWGEQWLNALRNIDYRNRLPRGASYARKGAVKKIDIQGNRIFAKVAGRRASPYSVTLILPPFFDPDWSNFLTELTGHPVIISKLLNRELDPALLPLAEQFGLKVFPTQWNDLKMQCSCPDWAVPCKHIASVIYKISAEIDNNPFLCFSLHAIDLFAELEQMGITIDEQQLDIPKLKTCFFEKGKKAKPYNPEDAYHKLSFAKLSPLHEALTALLTPFPVFYTVSAVDFRKKYLTRLKRVVNTTRKGVRKKSNLPVLFGGVPEQSNPITFYSRPVIRFHNSLEADVTFDERVLSFQEFSQHLASIPAAQLYDYQPATAALHTTLQLAAHLTANGAVIPQITQIPGKSFIIRWLPALLSKEVQALVNDLDALLPPDILYWQENKRARKCTREVAVNLLSLFVTKIIHLASTQIKGDLFENLFFTGTMESFSRPGEKALAGGIMAWLQKFYLTQGRYKPLLTVTEQSDDTFQVEVQIEKTQTNNNQAVPLREILTGDHFAAERFEILQSLAQLSTFIQGLDDYINSSGAQEIIMDTHSFTPFLLQMIPALQLLDISVLLPQALRQILHPKPSVQLKKKSGGNAHIRLDKLLDFEWQVAIGNTIMDEKTFTQFLEQSEGLIKFKSQYIYVSQEDLKKLYKHFSGKKKMAPMQMLRTALSGEYQGAAIAMTDEVKKLIRELGSFEEMPPPASLNARLRPYQQRGFSWIYRNARIGFGSVLADDMGLGKTLQVIAVLLRYKEEGLLDKKKVLVVAPTSLLTNWQAEVDKFAPTLQTAIYHGPQRDLSQMGGYDILLTSYGIVRSDADRLKKKKWHAVVLDEAQNIKNQNTAQTKAVKSIQADTCIALSGTPVENRLSELWSIMDYSNRGILGTAKDFAETFGNPIEQLNDPTTAEKLKKVTSPFLMRRLKTDAHIISDLPEKVEIDRYASLTGVQAALYTTTLQDAMNEIEGITRTDRQSLFVRQGLILQMILALKQICNHPTQFLKNGQMDATLSGKLDLLFDTIDSIVESNEKVLLFTQFAEMGTLLHYFITERYQVKPLFYYGGCSIKQRKEMVDTFQTNHADKIFILSLKAAGTGLNLTAANHVIHYDLWWNPAVEAQATDRAYRIGQKKNVIVQRFITKNTFEEKINDLIQRKKNLAAMTVATGENWIGNLSNRELHEIFGT